jgi:teichuronic acid biosynthesis glycosyltransferase TuaC
MHGSDLNNQGSSSLINWISRKVALRSDTVILVNKMMLEKLPNIKSKVSIQPCGINTNFFFPLEKIRKDRDEVQIGFPSSKERFVKNYPLFVEIISLLEKLYQLKISIVEFTNKSRSEVHKSLNEIDLLLMTSLSEGSPQIIKEALCCNTPIVSTNVGDVSNLLNGVNNSYVVETFEPTDFLNPIIKILNQNVNNKVYSNGRTKIFELELDEESVSKRLINIYNELISDKGL